jgi:UDP-N-acetylmuramoyl-tripeptide--D-alanyl-D-alanine ligase
MLRLADVMEALIGQRPPNAEQVITQAVIDSRTAIPGCMFVAIKGKRVDGHDYVSHAFDQGASFALVEKDLSAEYPQLDLHHPVSAEQIANLGQPACLLVDDTVAALQKAAQFWRNKLDVTVIGITGSVGKSTTKEMVAEVLGHRYKTLKNEGNYNNEIGLPVTILSLTEGHQRAVLEMGFYVPGEIKFLCDIARPKIGVVTNIGTVHAERAGSQEEIAQGKSELVQSLPLNGVAILNYDDPLVRPMADLTRAKVLYYGLDPKADLWADHIEGLGLDGIRFRLHYRNEVLHLRVPMLGRHSVHTALRAAAVGLAEGLDWEEIITGLRFGHMQLRLMVVRSENGALLVDDTYNASPQSTMAALNLLEELDGRKIAVLGDMLELGQYEQQGHEMIGIRAAEVADTLITVGERAQLIALAARRAGMKRELVTEVMDTQAATDMLSQMIGPEDVVLIKGSRGMRMDKIIPALEQTNG